MTNDPMVWLSLWLGITAAAGIVFFAGGAASEALYNWRMGRRIRKEEERRLVLYAHHDRLAHDSMNRRYGYAQPYKWLNPHDNG